MDLTKAFDTVNRSGLWTIKEKPGCPPRFLSVITQLHEGQLGQCQTSSGAQGVSSDSALSASARPQCQTSSAAEECDDVIPGLSDVKPFDALPGPSGHKAVPFIGTMFMLKPFGRYTVDTLGQMLNHFHDQYGPIFRARMGRDWIVYVERLEDIEKCFRSEGACPRRPLILLHKIYQQRSGLPHSLTTLEGNEWRKLRTPLNHRMNRPSSATYYLPAQNEVADDFAAILGSNFLSPDQLKELFFRYATESIGVVCFNRRLGFLDPGFESSPGRRRLLDCFRTNLRCTGAAMMGREFKYLLYRDAFYRTFQQATDHIVSHVKHCLTEALQEVERHRREGTWDEDEPNLVLSLLAEPSLSVADVVAVLEPLMTAGSDSTASGLQMLLYNLSRFPEQQETLARELQQNLPDPDQPVTAQVLQCLKYLAATAKESLRLSFPLPSGVARILPSDTVLGGYHVPKGTTVGISSQRTAMSDTYFRQPRHFLPERWLRDEDGQRETSISGFAHLPFGFGPRNCIGRRFAEQEIHLAVAKIIRKYRVSLPEEYVRGQEVETEYRPFVTPKHPFPFVFTWRQ
ncbi:1,25-dihydroxyvitamin D(3) 24-hydroxylase, mitochondrial-like [Babylonia areolata]|uniref:1,25-dihydroxyvitamin D(3) 24-hydroxylase, mitochondrial-like n=1 Tax=Babylonia areolata TaxID=304850 RepID=UPI003FD17E91